MTCIIYGFFVALIWLGGRPFGNTSSFGGLEQVSDRTRWRASSVMMMLVVILFTALYLSDSEEVPLVKYWMAFAVTVVSLGIAIYRWRKWGKP